MAEHRTPRSPERQARVKRKVLHGGDRVHAFEASDGKWYATEDPGLANSWVAWMIFAAGAVVIFVRTGLCLRSRAKIPKPA